MEIFYMNTHKWAIPARWNSIFFNQFCFTFQILKVIDRYLKNGFSESIVHMIKYANFQLYSVHPDGVI